MRDVERETSRAAFKVWHDLFLVSAGALRVGDVPVAYALGRKLSLVYSRSVVVRGWFGRSALRHRWRYWIRLHIAGMGLSYILMLVAFYVGNGKQLPLWKDLPHFMYWLIPMAAGYRSSFARFCCRR
ncbi:hypothetical protein V1282_001299 [Nitrobacteraceae bacterium AZCC 2146]